MRLWSFLPLALIAALVAVAGFVLLRGGARETVSEGRIGRPAPHFELTGVYGGAPISSAQFAGRPYVINLFASWCGPCRAEHPQLMALKARGVTIVGIAYKDRPEAARRFLNELGDPFDAIGLDPEGRFGLELGIAGVPETFVIGADGAIREIWRGPLTPELIDTTIFPALAAAD